VAAAIGRKLTLGAHSGLLPRRQWVETGKSHYEHMWIAIPLTPDYA
jgi:hypothetical protein